MPRDLGLPKYLDAKNTPAGTRLVHMGEYTGTVQGKFGDQHSFVQLADGQQWILSGGALNWRAKNGDLVEGKVYDVVFQGKGKMDKGKFAGKDVNNYALAVYSDEELVASGHKRAGATAEVAAKPTGAAPTAMPITSEVPKDQLDVLE
ncbi:MAG: hypothetical protein E6R04_04860 [Spirochaetes bacterium]|nr:MAG: hypothetical protein E6R04_04860 [Spirochaetota bacterium]